MQVLTPSSLQLAALLTGSASMVAHVALMELVIALLEHMEVTVYFRVSHIFALMHSKMDSATVHVYMERDNRLMH